MLTPGVEVLYLSKSSQLCRTEMDITKFCIAMTKQLERIDHNFKRIKLLGENWGYRT